MTLSEARSWEGTMSDVRTDGEASEYSRRESITSRSLSDWNCSDSVRTDDKASSGACSTASSLFKVIRVPDRDVQYLSTINVTEYRRCTWVQ